MKKATTVFHLIQGFGFIVIYDPAGRIYIKLDPYYQGHVIGLCGNNDGDPSDFICKSGIPTSKKAFIESHATPPCAIDANSTEIRDTCDNGNINSKEIAEPLCAILENKDYYGDLCLGTEEAAHYYKICMYDVCAAVNSGNKDEKREALCLSAMALAHFCVQKGIDGINLPRKISDDLYCSGKLH